MAQQNSAQRRRETIAKIMEVDTEQSADREQLFDQASVRLLWCTRGRLDETSFSGLPTAWGTGRLDAGCGGVRAPVRAADCERRAIREDRDSARPFQTIDAHRVLHLRTRFESENRFEQVD